MADHSSANPQYTQPPPSYQEPAASKKPVQQPEGQYGATSSGGAAAADRDPLLPRNDWSSEGEGAEDDIPDDFKYGVSVSQASSEVRAAFVRKVYGVLFCQILATTIVGAGMSTDAARAWIQEHTGLIFAPMILSFVSMGGVFWKRHSYPTNLILLSAFTLFEALTIGPVVAFSEQRVVMQAFIITTLVFFGLTIFTFQSRYDFSSMGGYLFAGLMALFVTLILGLFIPYSRTVDMLIAGFGCLIFAAYIVYDTHLILHRLHPDEWVMACISLYLDLLNLFLMVLRLLSNVNDR